MLALSRKLNQALWIGNIRVVVVQAERNKVRLAVLAPRSIHIAREELLPPGEAERRLAMIRAADEKFATGKPDFYSTPIAPTV